MKPQYLLLLFAGVVLAVAQEANPFIDPQSPPKNPEVAALAEMLGKLGARSKGMSLGENDDGVPTVYVYMHENPDLSALRGLPLRGMEIMGSNDELATGKELDLGPLAGMPLESLVIWKAPVKDLSPLKNTRLKKLLIMGAAVTDVSPLKDLPLTNLNLWATGVSDISPLKGLRLKHLNIDSNESARVTDLTPLEGMELETLEFHANGVTMGIDIVRGMKSLKEIEGKSPDAFWKEYDAAAPLREMAAKAGLKFTRLYGGAGEMGLWFHGDDLVDLAPLRGLPVVSLGFRDSKISDLRPLAGLPLRSLCVRSPALTDLSPLSGVPITSLYLNCDNLVDLGPLKESRLKTLSLRCPKLTDLSAIRHQRLEYLNLRDCGVTDLGSLEGISVEVMDFDIERITKGLDVLRGIKGLKQINGCKPEDFWEERDERKQEGQGAGRDPFAR